MEARLEKIDSVAADSINQTMLLRDAAGPATSKLKSEWLGLTDTVEGIGQDGLYKFQCA
jgi:hypothetical protein